MPTGLVRDFVTFSPPRLQSPHILLTKLLDFCGRERLQGKAARCRPWTWWPKEIRRGPEGETVRQQRELQNHASLLIQLSTWLFSFLFQNHFLTVVPHFTSPEPGPRVDTATKWSLFIQQEVSMQSGVSEVKGEPVMNCKFATTPRKHYTSNTCSFISLSFSK